MINILDYINKSWGYFTRCCAQSHISPSSTHPPPCSSTTCPLYLLQSKSPLKNQPTTKPRSHHLQFRALLFHFLKNFGYACGMQAVVPQGYQYPNSTWYRHCSIFGVPLLHIYCFSFLLIAELKLNLSEVLVVSV